MVVFIPMVPYMRLDIRVLTSARCQVRVADLQLALLFQLPHPAIPHLPTCPTKTHPARKFAQFSSYLPNWSHFMARRSRGWHSCHVAGNMWHSGDPGKRAALLLPWYPLLLDAEGELASLCPPSWHVSQQPTLHLGTCSALYMEGNRFTGLSPPLTTSFVFFRAKSTTDWQGPP